MIDLENISRELTRIRASCKRLDDHPEWRTSQVELDRSYLMTVVDRMLTGEIDVFALRDTRAEFVCPKCGATRPRNGMMCWNCGAK